jgi:hypothetical protein
VLKSIDKKMDQVIKSLAISAASGITDELQKMKTLKALELTSDEIGAYLGTSGTAVRTALSRHKNKPKSKKTGEHGE